MEEKLIGRITHFFSNINVGIIKLENTLKIGDKIRIKGATSDFEQTIDSMQIEHNNIDKAEKGDEIGVKVEGKVREGDEVYLVE